MGIYIKGMDMPSCCMFCPISNSCGCGMMNPPVLMTSKEMLADRPDWCPLVPVTPHGRLIDSDALKHIIGQFSRSWEYGQGVSDCWDALLAAPTIIEAEEE